MAELAPGAGDGLTVTLAPGSVLEARVVQPGVRLELPGGRAQRLAAVATDVRVVADAAARRTVRLRAPDDVEVSGTHRTPLHIDGF